MKNRVTIGRTWLVNLKNCGVEIESVDGVLVPNNSLFAPAELKNTADLSVLLASYIGLILYRMNGLGRLPYDLFFNQATRVREQLVYMALVIGFSILCIYATF